MADNVTPETEGDEGRNPVRDAQADTAELVDWLDFDDPDAAKLLRELGGVEGPSTSDAFRGSLRSRLIEEAATTGAAPERPLGEGLDDGANQTDESPDSTER